MRTNYDEHLLPKDKPTAIATAPARIDFAGGTTDINFFVENEKEGGATLNGAISIRGPKDRSILSMAEAFHNSEAGLRITSRDQDRQIYLESDADYLAQEPLALFRQVAKRFPRLNYHWLFTDSGIPAGSGLGNSASVAVALGGMLNHLSGKRMSNTEIADLCQDAELHGLKNLCGKQDQYAAAVGGINLFKFYPGNIPITDPLAKNNGVTSDTAIYPVHFFDKAFLHHLQSRMVLCYTGKSHYSGDANTRMKESYMQGGIAERALRNIRDVTLGMFEALKRENLDKVIELTQMETANRILLYDCIGKGENGAYEKIRKVGMASGARAEKILGAGAGGSLLFYVDPKDRNQLETALEHEGAKILPFKFNYDGLVVSGQKGV